MHHIAFAFPAHFLSGCLAKSLQHLVPFSVHFCRSFSFYCASVNGRFPRARTHTPSARAPLILYQVSRCRNPSFTCTPTKPPLRYIPDARLVLVMPHSTPALKDRASPRPDSRRPQLVDPEHYELKTMSGHESDDEAMGLTSEELASGRSRARSNSWKDRGQDTEGLLSNAPQESGGGRFFGGLNLADTKILKHLAVNAMLIASWYTFSLSISLVRRPRPRPLDGWLTACSITSGCSPATTSTSDSLSSPPACTCWSSLFYPP